MSFDLKKYLQEHKTLSKSDWSRINLAKARDKKAEKRNGGGEQQPEETPPKEPSKRKPKKNKKRTGAKIFASVFGLILGFCAVFVGYCYISAPKSDALTFVSGDLNIHFLELGTKYTGDCTYIKAGDIDILIDAGSVNQSATTINNYLANYITDGKIEYVIATHAHEDHIAGFYSQGSTKGVLDKYSAGVIIDFPKTNKTNPSASSVLGKYIAVRDAQVQKGAKHYTALECYNEQNGAQRTYDLGNSISMEIMYSYYYDHSDSSGENNYSVCLMFHQGSKNFLFTGDLEKKGEEKLVDYYQDNHEGLPHCEVYKAGHHGSKTSSCEKLLNAIEPHTVCVCCCCGTSEYTDDDANQFPTQEFVNRVAPHTDQIYVTSIVDNYVEQSQWSTSGTVKYMNGNIVVISNSSGVTVQCSNNNTLFKDTEWFKSHRTWPA